MGCIVAPDLNPPQDITPMTFKSYEMIQSEGFSQGVLFRLFFTFLARQHISTVI